MRAIVIGAGVAGLAVARALTADGHDVAVFEQAEALRLGGAAVTLWSNGTGVLSDLKAPLDGEGAPIDTLEQRDSQGRPLVSVDVARAARQYGHPHICLPRRRLLELLADGLPPETISFGRACVRLAQDGSGVRAEFADGTTAAGDLLVGADGRGSAVRDQVWGGDPGEPSGWATWQGVSPIPIEITSSRRCLLLVGRAGSCGLMPAGEGLLQWWFDLRWAPGAPEPESPLAMLRERFGAWASPVPEVLAAVDDQDVGFFPHWRHKVPQTWGNGRITLIGDAAHSMPPTRAQGANQALEDAWALARALRPGGDVPEALRAFERSRSPKAARVARDAGSEDYNRLGVAMARLIPSGLASRYYARWLGQISSYLSA